jgi:hypothetical protein
MRTMIPRNVNIEESIFWFLGLWMRLCMYQCMQICVLCICAAMSYSSCRYCTISTGLLETTGRWCVHFYRADVCMFRCTSTGRVGDLRQLNILMYPPSLLHSFPLALSALSACSLHWYMTCMTIAYTAAVCRLADELMNSCSEIQSRRTVPCYVPRRSLFVPPSRLSACGNHIYKLPWKNYYKMIIQLNIMNMWLY